ncbi:MFS transporter [Pantoea sp.]|uniref:MFS transporter n=1 Tax=Pantoea sp. TaxID=69393 RepID=UPI0039186338
MSILYFYMLFLVLLADGVMVFLTPVIVYQLTGSVEYSGLSYAIWWLPRIFLIPVIGRYIDRLGVRPLSILSDLIKISGCLFLALHTFSSDLLIAVSFGLTGSLISIGNSQTLISYEKIISLVSEDKEHHANLISRMDFLGMILGPLIGMIMIDYGYQYLLLLPCVLYLSNAIFFYTRHGSTLNETHAVDVYQTHPTLKKTILFISSAPLLLFSVFIAVGNNMFDGLVESAGAALIDQAMGLPVKYFGLIDVAAGVCGVVGTYIYGYTRIYASRKILMIFSVTLIVSSSLIMILFQNSLWVFILCYGISIIGKVFSGNLCRIIRIEVIPENILASTSSVIVLLNQIILPVTGLLLFLSIGSSFIVYLLMACATCITLLAGCLLTLSLSKANNINEKNTSQA